MIEDNRQLESSADSGDGKAFHKLEDTGLDLNRVEVLRRMLIQEERKQL